ncbi:DUF2207 domain-containing protein [Pseudomonadota bacterium]
MKNLIRKLQFFALAGAIFTLFLAANTAQAQYYIDDWEIDTFEVNVQVNEDSTLIVEEHIVADFRREEHHGIYRDIPIKYKDDFGNKMSLRFKLLSVEDEYGDSWWYEKSYYDNYVSIKAGDPDQYFSRLTTFIIKYEVSLLDKAVQYEDHDEIYWNVTGDMWTIPIENVTATFHLPGGITADETEAICFTGGFGETGQDCLFEIQDGKVEFYNTEVLSDYEGLTTSIKLPKGYLVAPSVGQRILWFLQDNWGYAIPIITFCILFYLWYTRGKDPKTNRDTIMPRYTPPEGMTPGELGTIVDEHVDMRDITSTIVDLAVRGYMKIKESKEKKLLFDSTEYTFIKLKEFNGDSTLKNHEKRILRKMFGNKKSIKLSELNNKFYSELPKIKEDIYNLIKKDGYFPANPDTIRVTYYGVGGVVTFISFMAFAGIMAIASLSVAIGFLCTGVIIAAFGRIMPVKTKKGVDAYYEILGVEEYINTAEKDRIKFQENQNMFEQLLPYAMTLGIADKWTKAFEGIFNEAPSWFEGQEGSHFSTGYLYGRLSSMTNNMNSTLASSPRSSGSGGWSGGSGFGGGGFSGGGFGGGGGGGW